MGIILLILAFVLLMTAGIAWGAGIFQTMREGFAYAGETFLVAVMLTLIAVVMFCIGINNTDLPLVW